MAFSRQLARKAVSRVNHGVLDRVSGAKRFMNIHEYQAMGLLNKFGVRSQAGKVASSPEEAKAIATSLLAGKPAATRLVVKSQIHAGGRGKGHFDNGFEGGVRFSSNPDEVASFVDKMIGHSLITKQTPPEGQLVRKVLINEAVEVEEHERYIAFVMDRAHGGPVIVCSQQGGMNIEDVAEEDPSAIISIPVDIIEGIKDSHAEAAATALGFTGAIKEDAKTQITNLYKLFRSLDCTQVEVNPLVVGAHDNQIYCVDAKLNFDDNAQFRQKEVFDLRDVTMEDPREVAASAFNLNYVGLDGNIGCMVNGAGLAMATMDIIKLHGGWPANFLDVGGGASAKQVEEAFKILTADPKVKALLVNIFGGIMKCDVIAEGVITAARNVDLKVPLVVRLEGTNVAKGMEMLKNSGLPIISATDLDDAAEKAVKSVV